MTNERALAEADAAPNRFAKCVMEALAAEVRRHQAMRCETCRYRAIDNYRLDYCRLWGSEGIPDTVTGCNGWAALEGKP